MPTGTTTVSWSISPSGTGVTGETSAALCPCQNLASGVSRTLRTASAGASSKTCRGYSNVA